MTTLTDKQAKLLRDKNFGVLATIREDGTPNVTPVWIDCDGKNVLFNTSYGRAKDLHLRRDPRCTILVVSSNDPYDWVSITGTAIEITEKGAKEQIDMLSVKYEGIAPYPYMRPGERRVKVTVRPERVFHYHPGDVQLEKAKARLKTRGLKY